MPGPEKQRQAFQFYGRRKGRPLRKGRQSLFDELLPRITIPLSGAGTVDPATLFVPRKRAVWLEIGFGGGEHLAHQAATHPDIGFLGCEVFESGIASGLSHIAEGNLENVRLHPEDVRVLLAALKPQSLDRVFLLFPDPWPKLRHHKRRIVSPAFLDAIARVMAAGAPFGFASDHHEYAVWTLERLVAHPAFAWTARSRRDWCRPDGWVETRYEAKALAAGRSCIYLTAVRQP
jgi:tRNA (guanine-N7-)-methyltransferase